jgi:hypothetical protein
MFLKYILINVASQVVIIIEKERERVQDTKINIEI